MDTAIEPWASGKLGAIHSAKKTAIRRRQRIKRSFGITEAVSKQQLTGCAFRNLQPRSSMSTPLSSSARKASYGNFQVASPAARADFTAAQSVRNAPKRLRKLAQPRAGVC